MFESSTLEMNPAQGRPHLGVGHIHASGIQPVFYLLCIVDLQEVITTELHVCQLLVMFKEVNRESHLARWAGCCGNQNNKGRYHTSVGFLLCPKSSPGGAHTCTLWLSKNSSGSLCKH